MIYLPNRRKHHKRGSNPLPRTNLFAEYLMDSLNDTSGNGYDMTNGVGTPALTTDRFGDANEAYLYNGANSHHIADNPAFDLATGDFSIISWAKPRSLSQQAICGKQWDGSTRGWNINTLGSGSDLSLRLVFRDPGEGFTTTLLNSATDDFPVNVYHMFAVTRSGSNYTLSIDAISDNGPIASGDFDINNIDIGSGEGMHATISPYLPFDGPVDVTRYYNEYFDLTELLAYYNFSKP